LINSHFGFTPLQEVWLGDCYPEHWYDHLPNDVADPLRIITEWTKQDITKLQRFLEQRNIVVHRPRFDSIDDHVDARGNLAKPPITPRDHYMVLGKDLWALHTGLQKKDSWWHVLDHYRSQGLHVHTPIDQPVNCLTPPSIVRMGRDLYLDRESHASVWGFVCEWAVEQCADYRINICETNGHSDGVFCPVAPGVIVASHYKGDYDSTFPGWQVFRLPHDLHNANLVKDWHVDDDHINNNASFSKHILEKAQEWVGNARETVFEVNMLVLDEKNVVAMKPYDPLTQWLDDRGITTHFFDFRARSFWDGGWHCLSLDTHRLDSKLDLFPHRGDNGVYWRLG